MFKVQKPSLVGLIFFVSFLWSVASLGQWHANEELMPSQYVKYKVEKGDWPVALLRRLNLKPIFGDSGSLEFFFRLNPDLKKSFAQNSKYIMPTGQIIILPIPKWEKNLKSNDYVLKGGTLKFKDPNVTRQTNDYTAVLNLKNLNSRKKLKTRSVASGSAKTTSWEKGAKAFAEKNNWNFSDYELGAPMVKIPVEPGSPLYENLVMSGLIVQNHEPRKTVYIEVPLYIKKQVVSDQRNLAAVNVNKIEVPIKSGVSIFANTFSSTRLYNIKDSNGESGKIGSDPSVGLQVGFDLGYGWLDLETTLQYQKESFKPDQTVSITQESNSRFEARVRQKIDLGFISFKLGGGVLSSPSFYTSGVSQLQSLHLERPFAHLGGDINIWRSSLIESEIEVNFDYILGQNKGFYRMNNGYRSSLWFLNRWGLSPSVSLNTDIGFSYQDDNPVDYQQVQQDLSLLLGIEYSF